MAEIRSVWTEYDVPVSDQEDLVEAFRVGDQWDVLSGAQPVSVEQYPVEDEVTRTIERFADGSIAVTGLSVPAADSSSAGFGIQSVENCSVSNVTGGTKYYNCKVYTWVGFISLSFYADYTRLTGSAKDYINRVWGGSYSMGPWVYGKSSSLAINRKTEVSASVPAEAQYSVVTEYQIPGTGAVYMTDTNKLWLRVANNTAWDNWDIMT